MQVNLNVPAIPTTSSASVDFSASGDNTIVSGVALQTIRVYKIFLVVGGVTNLTFKDGATGLTGAIPMLANGAFVLDFDTEPWFVTTAGNSFIINSSSGVQISGRCYYTQSDPT